MKIKTERAFICAAMTIWIQACGEGSSGTPTVENHRTPRREVWLTVVGTETLGALPPLSAPGAEPVTAPAPTAAPTAAPTPVADPQPAPAAGGIPTYVIPAGGDTPAGTTTAIPVVPVAGGSAPSGSGPSEAPSVTPSDDEIAACAQEHGVAKDRIMIVGDRNSMSLTTDKVVAIKLAGNQAHLDLHLAAKAGSETRRLAGLCLFLTGNQASATIQSDLDIGTLHYKGRGNRSRAVVFFAAGTALSKLDGDLGGNQAELVLDGPGHYPCQSVRVHGNASKFICN